MRQSIGFLLNCWGLLTLVLSAELACDSLPHSEWDNATNRLSLVNVNSEIQKTTADVPRRVQSPGLALTIFALIVIWLILCRPWFWGDRVVPFDSKDQFYPTLAFVTQSLHAGTPLLESLSL